MDESIDIVRRIIPPTETLFMVSAVVTPPAVQAITKLGPFGTPVAK